MNVAFITSELVPFSKTGGLGDVSGALPKDLAALGADIKVFTPKYYSINSRNFNLIHQQQIGELQVSVGGVEQRANVLVGQIPDSNVDVYFIDAPHYFHRRHIYTDDPDEDERFIFFQKAAIETIQRLNWKPDIIHCNDWQTGLIPLLLKKNYNWDELFEKTKTILTIHNIGYQGIFDQTSFDKAEIDRNFVAGESNLIDNGSVNFLKTGIAFADKLTTVSKTYADELLTAEYGAGLESALQKRQADLFGILNGIDTSIWDPETDTNIPFSYSAENLTGKEENKLYLLKKMGLDPDPDAPVIGMISRMVEQKGFDIITSTLPYLTDLNAKFILLGSGEKKYEKFFKKFAKKYSDIAAVHIGYNNDLAHLIEAGADIFLMPSKYEPCGMNQMYSLIYGAVPIVRKTGGLADTVFDWDEFNGYGLSTGNGFSFVDHNGYALSDAVRRAVKYYFEKDIWHKIQMNGMKNDFSFESSASKYLGLYYSTKSQI